MSTRLIIKAFRIIDNREWHSLPSVFHAKVRYERPGYAPFIGINRLVDFYRFERIILSGTHFIEKVVTNGNYGACWGRFTGRTKKNVYVDVLFSEAYKFEKGKIKMRRTYFHHTNINI
jgi:hypothetical protein